MKKIITSVLSLALLSGAIAGKDDPIHKIHSTVKTNHIFGFLGSKDIANLNATDKTFHEDTNRFNNIFGDAPLIEEINKAFAAGGSLAMFARNQKALQYIAKKNDPYLIVKVIDDFVDSNPSRGSLTSWIASMPQSLLNALDSSLQMKADSNSFSENVELIETASDGVVARGGDATNGLRYMNLSTSSRTWGAILEQYIKSKDQALKARYAKAIQQLPGNTFLARLTRYEIGKTAEGRRKLRNAGTRHFMNRLADSDYYFDSNDNTCKTQ